MQAERQINLENIANGRSPYTEGDLQFEFHVYKVSKIGKIGLGTFMVTKKSENRERESD